MTITYKTKGTHPGTLPSATIYMGGLLCLSFDQDNKCTVAVNDLVGNEHTWRFSIWSQETNVVSQQINNPIEFKQGDFPKHSKIYIDVQGGTTGGAYVYNGIGSVSIPPNDEKRFNLEKYWIDLEGPRGHNRKIENDANTLWPRFYINNALFCASKLSTDLFVLSNTTVTKMLGPIALGVVADIFLDPSDPDSKIEVNLPGRKISLDNSKRHAIYITNDCGYDFIKTPDFSDFHLHYKAFSGTFNGKRGKLTTNDQFHLVANTYAKGETESILAQASYDPLTDKAPCMLTALGQTSAFNK